MTNSSFQITEGTKRSAETVQDKKNNNKPKNWCRKIIFTNRKSALKSHHKSLKAQTITLLLWKISHISSATSTGTWTHFYVHVALEQSMPKLVQTTNIIIKMSFSKFQLAVSDSPPPALTSVRSRNAAQPQTRLSDLLFKGHRLPVQGLQSEGLPWDLNDRWFMWILARRVSSIQHQVLKSWHWMSGQSQNRVHLLFDQIVPDLNPNIVSFRPFYLDEVQNSGVVLAPVLKQYPVPLTDGEREKV